MPSLVSALSALAVMSFALANFTIYEDVPKPFVPGPVRLLKTYQKRGVIPPPEVLAAAVEISTVTAVPEENDFEYLCSVTIGGQTFNLDFDTGSADLWVFSTETPVLQRGTHNLYDPSKSGTAQPMPGYTWSITYEDGTSASGNVYQDTVSVGATVITGQAVEAAQQVSAQLVDEPADGIFGLALSLNQIKPSPQNTFFENAVNAGLSPIFTADLKKGAPGSYDFGFIDTSKYYGDITWVPLADQSGLWNFIYAGYTVGNDPFQASPEMASMDTGTDYLYLNDMLVTAYYDQVLDATLDPTLNIWTFPCSAELPSLSLRFGGWDAVVPGDYLNASAISADFCEGALQSNGGEPSLYGDTFIKSQFVIFDVENRRLGIAAKLPP